MNNSDLLSHMLTLDKELESNDTRDGSQETQPTLDTRKLMNRRATP